MQPNPAEDALAKSLAAPVIASAVVSPTSVPEAETVHHPVATTEPISDVAQHMVSNPVAAASESTPVVAVASDEAPAVAENPVIHATEAAVTGDAHPAVAEISSAAQASMDTS